MRSKLRASVIAVSMASIMAFSVTGCASQKTDEFTESEQSGQAVSTMSSSVVISADEPEVIDNSGKFTYAANSSRYSASIEGGTQTGLTCVGYTVYQDEAGQYFVVSGDERIDLENNEKIPEDFRGDLRIEKEGGKLYVYKTDEDAQQARDAVAAAQNAQAGVTTDDRIVTVNGMKLYLNSAKIIQQDSDIFVPIEAALRLASDGSHIERGPETVTFYIYDYAESKIGAPKYEEFVIDLAQPNVIWTADKSAHLDSDADLVRINDKTDVLYFNPEALAKVFDWQVSISVPFTGKTGCLDIVSDYTMDMQDEYAAIMVSEDLAIETLDNDDEKDAISSEEIQADLQAQVDELMTQAEKVNQEGQDLAQVKPKQETSSSSQGQSQQASQAPANGVYADHPVKPGDPQYDPNFVNPVTGVEVDWNGNGKPDWIEGAKGGKVNIIDTSGTDWH